MIEKNFSNWDLSAVQELEKLCRTLPILPTDRAKAFFKEASRATKAKAKVVDRESGNLFESMMGLVSASDRKDFSATWDDDNPETLGHGVLMVETYDEIIGFTFCLARISEDTFVTYGWTGEKRRQGIKSLRSKEYSLETKKWWQV